MSALCGLGRGWSSKLSPLPVIATGPLHKTLQRPAVEDERTAMDAPRCQILASASSSSPVTLCMSSRTGRPWPVCRQICIPAVRLLTLLLGWVVTHAWHCPAVGACASRQTARIALLAEYSEPL